MPECAPQFSSVWWVSNREHSFDPAWCSGDRPPVHECIEAASPMVGTASTLADTTEGHVWNDAVHVGVVDCGTSGTDAREDYVGILCVSID